MIDIEDCIVFNLAKAYQSAHAAFAGLLRPHGLTPIQALVLGAVGDQEGASAGDIGRRLKLDNATLSGVLERLGDAGWIVRRTDQADRRVQRILLTDQGRGFRSTLGELRETANQEILHHLSLEEKVLLKRLLRDVRDG